MPGYSTAHTLKFEEASSDDATTAFEVIAAVAGKKLRVFSFVITTDAAGQVTLRDAAADTVRASFHLAANSGVSYPGGFDGPLFETAEGQGLECISDGTTPSVDISVAYAEV